MKLGTQTFSATVNDIKYQMNVNTLEHATAKKRDLKTQEMSRYEAADAIIALLRERQLIS